MNPDCTVEADEDAVVETHVVRVGPAAVEAVAVVLVLQKLLEHLLLQTEALVFLRLRRFAFVRV